MVSWYKLSDEEKKKLEQEFFKVRKKEKLSLGQKYADALTFFVGSWTFIILLLVFMSIWVIVNLYALIVKPFDPYPFILFNLILSMLAAIQAPIILMSENREAERDRKRAVQDYFINRKAEHEIADMQQDLEIIKQQIKELHEEIVVKGNHNSKKTTSN